MTARWMMLAVLVVSAAVAKADFRTGNLDVTNNLTVASTGTIHTLEVAGTGTIHTLAVDHIYGNTSVVISVENPAIFNSTSIHNGTVYTEGALFAYGIAQFCSELTANSNASFYGRVRMENNLRLSSMFGNGNLYVEGTATVAGATVLTTATGVGTNDARYLAALTNAAAFDASGAAAAATNAIDGAFIASKGGLTNESDTLATVLARGNNANGLNATNFADIQGVGRMVWGNSLSLDSVASTAYGAERRGYNTSGGSSFISNLAVGASQAGLAHHNGTMRILQGAFSAQQDLEVGFGSSVAEIGTGGIGAGQRGQVLNDSSATNDGVGAIQLLALTSQHALTTSGGDGSILLGAGIASNRYSIVAGDGQESHGDGSITAGGGFYGTGSGLTGITAAQVGAVATNDARYLAALTNESDTLATVLARGNNASGQSATNFLNLHGEGVMALGVGLRLSDIDSSALGASQVGYSVGVQTIANDAYGASQIGYISVSGTQSIGSIAIGATQRGYNGGVRAVSSTAYGSSQFGANVGNQTIGTGAFGSAQFGYNDGSQTVGASAHGALQSGYVSPTSAATNSGVGALQLHDLSAGQKANTTTGGDASILLGAGTSSNKNAIVAGDGEVSHGDGSITAGGGFCGPSATITATLTASNIVQTSGGWDDLLFPVNTIYAVGLTDIEYLPQSNSINFKATCNTNFASDNVWLVGQLSHSTKTNSAFISPHIHFIQTSATQTNVFFIRYKRYKIGDAVPATWTDLPTTNNVLAYTSGTIHQIAEGANIAGPFGISENFDFKIWSRGGEATQLKFFDIHFQRDSLGSDLEFQKTF